MLLLILIPFIIGVIEAYMLHNCTWYDGKPFQLPLIIWFLIALALLIPIINIIAAAVILFFLIGSICEHDLKFNNDHWLFKRY